jgi:hypothetical protein
MKIMLALAVLALCGCGLSGAGSVRVITPQGVYERGTFGLYGDRHFVREQITFQADGVTTASVARARFDVQKETTVAGMNAMWAGAAALAAWIVKGRIGK